MYCIPFSIVTIFAIPAGVFDGTSVAVIGDGDDVSGAMNRQSLARQLNLSGTAYVCKALEGADLRLDYYTAEGRQAIGAHAAFAALWTLQESNRLPDTGRVTVETVGGLLYAEFEGSIVRISHVHAPGHQLSAQVRTVAQGQLFL